MENYQGDLADIVRASVGELLPAGGDWQFPSDPINYPSGIEGPTDDFGDPFSNIRDPLLHELPMPFFINSTTEMINVTVDDDTDVIDGFSAGDHTVFSQKIIDEQIKTPCNIFSRILQISPANAKFPEQLKNPALVDNDMISSAKSSSKGCLVENMASQISSPRINTGIKRRKNQAKKVVCIPAPAPVAANSRPSTGEVVPSDLWAWRKYGQKPIKGSPYPRGYYRCSSSKGCSARKQVERSRTDPNMLVITYNSEHNHPWPTQRNALAGSTRSQLPSKNNSKNIKVEDQHKAETDTSTTDNIVSSSITISTTGNSTTAPSVVKEETEEFDKQIDMDGEEEDDDDDNEFRDQSYRPALPDSNQSDQDFFAGLGEIEGDPLNLMFTQGIPGHEGENNKAMDPFYLFDWSGNTQCLE